MLLFRKHFFTQTFRIDNSVSLVKKMKMKSIFYILVVNIITVLTCSTANESADDAFENDLGIKDLKIVSLGDSYTIGQSVCNTCRFPEQLKKSLIRSFDSGTHLELEVIAKSGWTTADLISAIDKENLSTTFDLATLLIGVNNQFQGIPFHIYEKEFKELIEKATFLANQDKSNLIVISIPDYAYTPFGSGDSKISKDIDKYNTFAKDYCKLNNITYVHITDITRDGLKNPDLVASDGLHPSELAYSKFVSRMLPVAIEKLK